MDVECQQGGRCSARVEWERVGWWAVEVGEVCRGQGVQVRPSLPGVAELLATGLGHVDPLRSWSKEWRVGGMGAGSKTGES